MNCIYNFADLKEKINKPNPKLKGYSYSLSEAKKYRDLGKLLSIRIETCLKCDLNCHYCCNNSSSSRHDRLEIETIFKLIDESANLGAKSIVVIGGGEPTIDPRFKTIVDYIFQKGLTTVVFTNAQTLSYELAYFLLTKDASVIVKLDSVEPSLQDYLVDKKGALSKILKSIDILDEVGFLVDKKNPRAGASMVVTKHNINTIEDTWRFCRQKGLFPNLEMLIPNGRAGLNAEIQPTFSDYKWLKLRLLEIDKLEFGFSWLPNTPLIANGCFQCIHNVYIDVRGWARPCSSIHVKIANIANQSLAQILQTPFFKIARNIESHLTGKCSKCKFGDQCIGCRGMAFTVGKNNGLNDIDALCSSDPTCWKA